MRAYAVIPPMLNQMPRSLRFVNRNGLIAEPMSDYKERKQTTNWTAEEREVFKEKYLERPKQFGHIAEVLEKKVEENNNKLPPVKRKYLQVKKRRGR